MQASLIQVSWSRATAYHPTLPLVHTQHLVNINIACCLFQTVQIIQSFVNAPLQSLSIHHIIFSNFSSVRQVALQNFYTGAQVYKYTPLAVQTGKKFCSMLQL